MHDFEAAGVPVTVRAERWEEGRVRLENHVTVWLREPLVDQARDHAKAAA
jgi:hypothetical protein